MMREAAFRMRPGVRARVPALLALQGAGRVSMAAVIMGGEGGV